jgi:hypothetical protein
MAKDNFAQRLGPVIGKPAATLFVESGTDRHFIIEITLGAVAGYLGGKFLDAFVDGLGITDPAKHLGEGIKHAVEGLGTLIVGEKAPEVQQAELDKHIAALQDAATKLGAYAANETARLKAEDAVRKVLQDKGLPQSEAKRIAKAVGGEMLKASPAAAGRG